MSGSEPASRRHYLHRLRYTVRERLVGAFVLGGPLLLMALFFVNSETRHLFEERVSFNLYLHNAAGVSTETPVKISGIEAGRVTAIDIAPDHRIHLTLGVRKRFAALLRSDSRASLGKFAILGKAVIEITPGSPNLAPLPEESTLAVEEIKSLDEIAAEVGAMLEQLRTTVQGVSAIVAAVEPGQVSGTVEDLQATAHNLRQLSERLAEVEVAHLESLLDRIAGDFGAITEQLKAGRGALGTLLFDPAAAESLSGAIEQLNQTIAGANRLVEALHPAVVNAAAISGNLRKGTADFPETAAEIRQMVARFSELSAGLAGELQEFPQLLTQMRMLMEESDRLLEGVQRVWPLSRAVSPGQETLSIRPLPSND